MNAIIMAAGTSSRFVPLCWERPKGLLEVKGEILVERQIKQLKEAGVDDITIVTGYMAEKFEYLKHKFGVSLVYNPDFSRYNNTSTLMCVLDRLGDTWICSSDNYFTENVFMEHPTQSQYSAEWSEGDTGEYCLMADNDDNITNVTIGGSHAWFMIGHVFFDKQFSDAFKKILEEEYQFDETRQGYWEDVYIKHIEKLPPMRIRKYQPGIINEFDSLEELREFDGSYIDEAKSNVLKKISEELHCKQGTVTIIKKCSFEDVKYSFAFECNGIHYVFKSNNLSDGYILEKASI